MLDRELIRKVLSKALCRGGSFAELYVEETVPTSITYEDKKIEQIVSGSNIGAGLRVIHDLRTIYAFTNDLNEKSLLGIAETIGNAIQSKQQDIAIDLSRQKSALDFNMERFPYLESMERKIDLVKEADHTARTYSSLVKQVKAVYSDTFKKVQIANSDGVLVEEEKSGVIFFLNVVASDNGIVQTAFESKGGIVGFEIFDREPVSELAQKAAKRAVAMLKADKAPAGEMPVVLSSEAGGTMVHEAVGHGLEGDFIHSSLSVYSDKLGEKVASPLVTVIDDATIPEKRGSFKFDDEGVPSEKTVLIENGILTNFMYDKLNAMKGKTVSTGNGRRQSYKHKPIPRMTNTMIASGQDDPEEIVKSTPNGLFVKKMGGGEVNIVNGDFVFEVSEGYIIEKGQVKNMVRGATLTGNGPQVLRDIDMTGKDLGFAIGTCGKDGQGAPVSDAQPTLRIKKLIVGGTKI